MVRVLLASILLMHSPQIARGHDALTVLVEFEYQPEPGLVAAVQEELEALFGDAGLKVELRQIVRRPLRGRNQRAAVVRFVSPCLAPPPVVGKPDPTPRTLAFVRTAGERILDLVEVNCTAVSSYIAHAIRRFDFRRVDALYRRALARVVAHELLHWIMNEKGHTESPLFRPQVDALDLVADGVELGEDELTRLRGGDTRAAADGF